MKRIDWFRLGRDGFLLLSRGEGLVSAGFKGEKTGFGWFQGGKDWFRLVSEWEGLVSAGFSSFRFLVTTLMRCHILQDYESQSVSVSSPGLSFLHALLMASEACSLAPCVYPLLVHSEF